MAKDFNALKVELENSARYDTAVRGKSLQPLMALLNEEEIGQRVFRATPAEDVREAIGDGVRSLTADQKATLRLFIGSDNLVDFRKPAIRAEIREVFSGKTDVLTRLRTVAQRTRTYGEAFGFEQVRKEDLWRVLPQIFKSYMAEYLRR